MSMTITSVVEKTNVALHETEIDGLKNAAKCYEDALAFEGLRAYDPNRKITFIECHEDHAVVYYVVEQTHYGYEDTVLGFEGFVDSRFTDVAEAEAALYWKAYDLA